MARFSHQTARVLAHHNDDWHPCYPGGLVDVHLFVGFDGPRWCETLWPKRATGWAPVTRIDVVQRTGPKVQVR
jgi:hypothetical protein